MTAHDVAAVLAEAPCLAPPEMVDCEGPNQRKHPECALAALAAAGYAVVKCDHPSATGVDQTPVDDGDKVWRCDACGYLFRSICEDGISRTVEATP